MNESNAIYGCAYKDTWPSVECNVKALAPLRPVYKPNLMCVASHCCIDKHNAQQKVACPQAPRHRSALLLMVHQCASARAPLESQRCRGELAEFSVRYEHRDILRCPAPYGVQSRLVRFANLDYMYCYFAVFTSMQKE